MAALPQACQYGTRISTRAEEVLRKSEVLSRQSQATGIALLPEPGTRLAEAIQSRKP